jgi:ABC-type sugar transport system ATPase subunit
MARVEFSSVGKRFGDVPALTGVSLAVEAGECHALVGENGAGKSTLVKLLAGIHRPDAGAVLLDGQGTNFAGPADALAAGVAIVHQELAFAPDLSVAENLAMGRYPRRGPLLDRRAMWREGAAALARIGAELDVRAPMRSLSVAQEQLVQIAAAVGRGARILIFDEPTSSLSEPEAQRLFALIKDLKAAGTTVFYVSHRLPEVFELCDRISVLRDGRLVATLPAAEATTQSLVAAMIGRELQEAIVSPPEGPPGETLLEVEGLSSSAGFHEVGFSLRAGEIVGLAGLVGAGRSEVARALFGLDPAARGRVRVAGRSLGLRGGPRAAIAAGLALVPEDRKRQGLVLSMGARANWSLPVLRRFRRRGLLDRKREARDARTALAALDVRAASIDQPVATLSGGNQQKVVIGKWLSVGGRVLIVDEPTRGVDVGAKAAIHKLLVDQARAGVGILLISSELPELLALSTRVLVMRAGRVVAEMPRGELSQQGLMRRMAGVA